VQGPDHSSGYLERFLQLANDDPDHLPGLGPAHRAEMEAGFAAADTGGQRQRCDVLGAHPEQCVRSGGLGKARSGPGYAH
jgi:2-oxoglutarate dehydrogenase complex dehydrogenase (E1) component-like enzyme